MPGALTGAVPKPSHPLLCGIYCGIYCGLALLSCSGAVARLVGLDPQECLRPEFVLIFSGASSHAPVPACMARFNQPCMRVFQPFGCMQTLMTCCAMPCRAMPCRAMPTALLPVALHHAGNAPLPQSRSYAQCYGGHQFGHWAGGRLCVMLVIWWVAARHAMCPANAVPCPALLGAMPFIP